MQISVKNYRQVLYFAFWAYFLRIYPKKFEEVKEVKQVLCAIVAQIFKISSRFI